jgi:hypothetical protein
MAPADSTWTYIIQIVVPVITVVGGVVAYFIQKYSEKRAVNRAILAEVNRLITAVRRHHDWWILQTARHSKPLVLFSYAVYKQQVTNVGVLRKNLVGAVVQFYGYIRFINNLQKTRKDFENAAEFEAIYTGALENFLELYENRFDKEFTRQGWKSEKHGAHTRWRL